MSRPAEILGFATLALGAHLGAWVWVAEPGSSSGGEAGDAPVSLVAAPGEITDLVARWTAPPEATAVALDALPQPGVPQTDLPVIQPVAMPPVAPRPESPESAPPDAAPAAPELPPALTAPPQDAAPALMAPAAPDRIEITRPARDDAAPDGTTPARPGQVTPDHPVAEALPAHRPKARPAAPPKPAAKPAAQPPARKAQKAQGGKTGQHAGDKRANTASTLSPAARQSLMAKWGAAIRNGVERRKRYPRGTRAQGTAKLRLTVSRAGHLIGVSLLRSSGDAVLDKAAISAVRRARFPAAPKGLSEAQYHFNLPVELTPR